MVSHRVASTTRQTCENRLLAECVRRANEKRELAGKMLLPERVTPHTLRRTFASLAFMAGRDPRWRDAMHPAVPMPLQRPGGV
jgi:integrase